MSVTARLLKVGSMAASLGVYISAMILQKALGLGRVLLFAYLMRHVRGQYGLWALGMMIFSIASPLLCMGSNHGLVRYVSYYEARGVLQSFYRRVRWAVLACCALLTLVAFLASDTITQWVIASCEGMSGVSYRQQLMLCWAALGNAFLMALYFNLLGFMGGMRVYRMISAMEILFGALFAAMGATALLIEPTGLALLLAHMASLAVVLVAGTALLHIAVKRIQPAPAAPSAAHAPAEAPDATRRGWEPLLDPAPEPEHGAAGEPRLAAIDEAANGKAPGVFLRTLRFGLVAMVGNTLWVVANQISFWLTSHRYSPAEGSVFHVFMSLSQPVILISTAAWTVIFAHIARHWEGGRRDMALLNLQTAFKAVALATMTLGIAMHLLCPLWVRILPATWRAGQPLLPGLLLFFLVIGNLGLLNMLVWLQERPAVTIITAAAGGLLNWTLAALWMGSEPADGLVGAAWAAGVGMAVGSGGVAAVYFLATRVRFHASTYVVMAAPLVLLLNFNRLVPAWAVACIWAALLTGALATGWVFNRRQKALLVALAKRAANVARGRHA
ncbi:MAG TPA: hypothetical protein VNA25_28120 [Phycisphaerae bacterium]|nr:hypothetical protein [Phycisphaerae bacterium]